MFQVSVVHLANYQHSTYIRWWGCSTGSHLLDLVGGEETCEMHAGQVHHGAGLCSQRMPLCSLSWTLTFKFDHYAVFLAHYVFLVWYLKCRLVNRKDFFKFIIKGLGSNVLHLWRRANSGRLKVGPTLLVSTMTAETGRGAPTRRRVSVIFFPILRF